MFRRLFSGWFTLPNVSPLEGFFLRLFFAILLIFTFRIQVGYTEEPNPVGLLKWLHQIDSNRTWLTWLADEQTWAVYKSIFIALLAIYVSGYALPLVLPALAVMHVLPFTLFASQGFNHHGNQVVSCTLIIQAASVLYYCVRRKFTLMPPDEKLRAWMLVQSQVIITGMYFISVFTKMDNSGGMWWWNSHHTALDMIKTQHQSYLNHFDSAFSVTPPVALWMLTHVWIARIFFTSGLILETVCILGIGNRTLGFIMAVSLIFMHRSIDLLMGGVAFLYNELLCIIFLLGLPFALACLLERVQNKTVRTGILAGAGLGILASFWTAGLVFSAEESRAFASLGTYLLSLVNQISIWSSLSWDEWAGFFYFIMPAAFTAVIGALIGGASCRLFQERALEK
jgi:hypothetical protein